MRLQKNCSGILLARGDPIWNRYPRLSQGLMHQFLIKMCFLNINYHGKSGHWFYFASRYTSSGLQSQPVTPAHIHCMSLYTGVQCEHASCFSDRSDRPETSRHDRRIARPSVRSRHYDHLRSGVFLSAGLPHEPRHVDTEYVISHLFRVRMLRIGSNNNNINNNNASSWYGAFEKSDNTLVKALHRELCCVQ